MATEGAGGSMDPTIANMLQEMLELNRALTFAVFALVLALDRRSIMSIEEYREELARQRDHQLKDGDDRMAAVLDMLSKHLKASDKASRPN